MIEFIEAFILLLVIMDPPLSISVLLSLIKRKKIKNKMQIIKKGVMVAAIVFFVFAIAGDFLLNLMGVNIETFRAAGGIILVILGVQMVLGLSFNKIDKASDISVIIGTPLITGPAVIMATILLVKGVGLVTTLFAGICALLVTFVSIVFAVKINDILGDGGIRMISTMMGIVTIAWGIEFLLTGVIGFL
ncbi:MAG: MarC family protein [Nanoarchaeota archaeon]|nr:MarC family protein [Nanoarchaeota archaeon]MBU1135588.1 MarC family protein [Nanoarchaeota archaeon]